MARGQMKKVQVKVPAKTEAQAENMIFALDIGTRSVIGMVGVVEENKMKIIAIEKEEHTERAMIDGQIENIEKVSMLAGKVKRRLESKLHTSLKRVCVAAAGRALRTSRVDYEMELPGTQLIDDEIINRLEAGAISKAEEIFDAENETLDDSRRFYLVGYTVCQYFLDQYLISSLKEHRGKHIKVDLIATFLPSEVVESLYTTMNKAGLEVASITLEPIAAINAAIPESLRLLNLVMVDIGAGTSDIAACTGGSVTGYTMATVAGDEVTEAVMKEFLVDFKTAENIKAQIDEEEHVTFTDILGFERTISRDEVFRCIQNVTKLLSEEISEKILAVNGAPPSALFLAGGGSKLAGLKERITSSLEMDANRVAIAGSNFRASAFSDEYDLNNPEYATPLGIVISSGLNLINDSFRVTLNDKSAKLFRSGSFTVMNLLMMNGYSFQDMLGRPGRPVSVMVNGKRKVFYGTAAQPAALFINKKEGKLSAIVRAGDNIEFIPAVPGVSARPFLGDIEGALDCEEITLNGEAADLETPLKNGDVIRIKLSKAQIEEKEGEEPEKNAVFSAETAAGRREEPGRNAVFSAVPAAKKRIELPIEVEPLIEEEPLVEEESLIEEEPLIEEELPIEAEPLIEEESLIEAEPLIEEESLIEEELLTEGEPLVEEELLIEGEPLVEEEPLVEAVSERISVRTLEEPKETAGTEGVASQKEQPVAAEIPGTEQEPAAAEEKPQDEKAGFVKGELQGRKVGIAEEEPQDRKFEFAEEKPQDGKAGLARDELQVRKAVFAEEGPQERRAVFTEEGLQVRKAGSIKEKPQDWKAEIAEEGSQDWKARFTRGELQEKKAESAAAEIKESKGTVSGGFQNRNEESVKGVQNPQKEFAAREPQNQRGSYEPEKRQSVNMKPGSQGMSQMRLNFGVGGTTLPKEGFAAREASSFRGQGQRDIPLERKASARKETILFQLNGSPIRLPRKKDGAPYYLMDMIEHSGIDLKQPKGRVILSVNGAPGSFQQRLFAGDIIRIEEEV